MTEAIATDMLRSYIDRILRLKAEQDDLAADIREIYAEAKANGYDKTGIGNVVSHVRQRDKKGTDAVAEANAIFALYLSAYDGTASRTHTHAREETEQRANVLSQREAGPVDHEPGGRATAQHLGRDGRERPAAISQTKASVGNGATVTAKAEVPSDSMSGEVSRPSHPAGGGCNVVMEDVTAGETAPHPTSASEPDTRDAETPRAGQREQPARGTIHDDEELPTWLRRGHPDCQYGAQGRG